jgi:hypothetical protein
MLFNRYVNVFLTTRHEYPVFMDYLPLDVKQQLSISQNDILISMSMRVMIKVVVFNSTFNSISVVSW